MNYRQIAISGSRWTSVSLAVRAVLQLAQTMILARLLVPEDFGLMAVFSATYVVFYLFVDFGLSNAIVHFPEQPRSTLSTLYWLNAGLSILMAILVSSFAWPISLMFGEQRLAPMLLLMSLAFPLAAAGQQFRAIAEKNLMFSKLATIELLSSAIGFVCAVWLATTGIGVYALVAAFLTTVAASSGLSWMMLSRGYRPLRHFRISEAKPFLRFGAYKFSDSMVGALQSQADLLVAAATAPPASVGLYTVPRDLALRLANTVVNPIVTRVGLPIMARLQSDRQALKLVYLKTIRMTSSVNFPLYAGMAAWANELVPIVLGQQWSGAAKYLQLFAIWGMIRSTANPVGTLLYATGHVKRAFVWNVLLLAVSLPVLLLGAHLEGIHGLAVAMVAVQAIAFYPSYRYLVYPTSGIGFLEYVSEFVAPLALTALAISSGYWLAMSIADGWLALAIGAAISATLYLVLSARFNRAWLGAMLDFSGPLIGMFRRDR